MKKEEQEQLIEKTKKICVKEGCAYGFMEGFGLRYITPYALALGANNAHIGLLNSIPHLIGNLSQLLTIHDLKSWSRKKITFLGVIFQALMWILLLAAGVPFFIFSIKSNLSLFLLILTYTLLVLFGAFAGPAWTSWMKDIITKNRGDYFGKRSRIIGFITIGSMLIAGFILDYFKNTKIFLGFVIIFLIAFLGRVISGFLMLRQYEPKFKQEDKDYFTIFQFMKKMAYTNFGKFTIYYALICLVTSIASPFFAVYLLKDLGFSYVSFMIVILSSAVTTYIAMPLWGKFGDKYGNLEVMKLTGQFIALIPFLWLLSPLIISINSGIILFYLILVEILSGIIWAGFNLAVGNFIYDAVSREKLAICSSYFNILSSFGVVLGAVLGGLIASSSLSFFGINAILLTFLISTIARILVYVFLSNKIKEVRPVAHFEFDLEKEALKFLHSISLRKFFEPAEHHPSKIRHI